MKITPRIGQKHVPWNWVKRCRYTYLARYESESMRDLGPLHSTPLATTVFPNDEITNDTCLSTVPTAYKNPSLQSKQTPKNLKTLTLQQTHSLHFPSLGPPKTVSHNRYQKPQKIRDRERDTHTRELQRGRQKRSDDMSQSLELLLIQFLMPDNDARRQAEDQIKRLAKDPQVVPALVQHLRTAKTPNVRQLAAVLLRKKITGHWAKLSPQIKHLVKQSLIESITMEHRSKFISIALF